LPPAGKEDKMLRSIKDMHGFKIQAKDGEIGKVDEFFFDDHTWTIRYLIADTGTWLVDNRVLISPVSIGKPDWNNKTFPVNQTKEQVEKSPKIENDKPVSRQNEIDLAAYYSWPSYWTGIMQPTVGVMNPFPVLTPKKTEKEITEMEKKKEHADPNLRSTNEVINYNINATDGNIGHVEDFLVDDESWVIRYLVVDTNNWLPGGRKVILALNWVKDILWPDSSVNVNLTKDEIKNSPEYDPSIPTEKEYEAELHNHYNKPKYWE